MKIKKILLLLIAIIIVLGTSFVYATEIEEGFEESTVVEEGDDDEIPEGSLIQPRGEVSEENEPVPVSIDAEDGAAEIPEDEYSYEFIDNDYFSSDSTVDLSNKSISGNLFVIAQKAILNDVNVSGSVFILAQNVELNKVSSQGSFYVAAETITTENSYLKNIYSASQKLDLKDGTILDRNVYSLAKECIFNAISNNDVGILADNISIGNDAIISGNCNITAKSEPTIPESATLSNYNFNKMSSNETKKSSSSIGDTIVKVIGYVVSTIVIALVILNIFKGFSEKVQDYTIGNIVKKALVALLLVIAIPIAIIILMATVIGIRVSFVLMFIYIIALLMATPIACIIISIMIAKNQNKTETKNIVIYTAIVALIVSILELIPVISGIVSIVLGLVGFGTLFTLPFSKKIKE